MFWLWLIPCGIGVTFGISTIGLLIRHHYRPLVRSIEHTQERNRRIHQGWVPDAYRDLSPEARTKAVGELLRKPPGELG